MDTRNENQAIENTDGVADPQDAEPTPTCPFCTVTLTLSSEGGVGTKYECQNADCNVGYSRCVISRPDGSMGGFETAHHAEKNALVQVVDYGSLSAIYTRRSGDEEGCSLMIPCRCTLKNVFDNIERFLPSGVEASE